MNTDYRALCAELLDALDGWHQAVLETGSGWVKPDEACLLDRARAALAEPERVVLKSIEERIAEADAAVEASMKRIRKIIATPARQLAAEANRLAVPVADGSAVPEGGEPAAIVGEPSDAELLATLDKATAAFPPRHPEAEALNAVEYPLALELRKARAVLARFGHHSPDATKMVGPAEEDVAELVTWLRGANWDSKRQTLATRAADLLEQRHPAPVPGGMIPVEYWDMDSGARIVSEPSEEGAGGCWIVLNSRCVNPLTEFPTARAAWDALQQAHALSLPTDAGQSPA